MEPEMSRIEQRSFDIMSVCEFLPSKALTFLAALTIGSVVFRAWNQDFTIDEANTFFFYLSGLSPDMWHAGSNNHLLSSLLIRATTAIFGFSPFAMRIPAMAGAIFYAASTAKLVSLLIEKSRVWARVCLYALMAFNPFVMDYLVPARGYSPALACEITMLVLTFYILANPGNAPPVLSLISIIAALGVAFNYSFLFTISSMLFCIFVFLAFSSRRFQWRFLMTMGAPLFGPFVAIIILLCGDNIVEMPKSEIDIGWGTRSFGEMLASFSTLSFNYPNPFLTPPLIRQFLETLMQILPWLVVIMFAGALLLTALRVRGGIFTIRTYDATRDRFALFVLCVLLLSLALHAALYFSLGVKLPRTRTGLHWIPLLTLFVASPLFVYRLGPAKFGSFFAPAHAAAAGAIAINFAFSQHFSYFQEWRWNADVCTATDTALRFATAMNTRDVRIAWEFDAAGNFYGDYLGYGEHRLNEVPEAELLTDDGSDRPTVFILPLRLWAQLDTTGLTPVYESRLSGTFVALRHAKGVEIPVSAVPFNVKFHSPCSQHGWFGNGKRYPGAIIY